MSFWKKKKYCEYCGSEKKSDGSCSNPKCIAYKEKLQRIPPLNLTAPLQRKDELNGLGYYPAFRTVLLLTGILLYKFRERNEADKERAGRPAEKE